MLRHQSEQPSDIIFEAEEDLYQSPTKQILMLKGSERTVQLTKNRMFQSYVNEFCGMVGLASNTLRLQIEKREINPHKLVNSSCLIKVAHTPEFHNAPNNSLKPSLRSILEQGYCSDLKLVFKSKTIPVNKCILTSRSQKFASMICSSTEEIKFPHKNIKSFWRLLIWIYSGELDVPDDIIETIDLFYLAQEFQVIDLMWRCEEEIILKISPSNVVDVLVKYYPALTRDVIIGSSNDDDLNLEEVKSLANDELQYTSPNEDNNPQLQSPISDTYKAELSQNILNACKSVFIKEFPDVVLNNPDLEQRLASVPGLIIALFSHINEQKHRKKKNKVRFSFVEEIHTPISFEHQFGDNITDTHSESSSRI
ncbi:ankyrin repeat and fyve domain-containing protein 1 [Stylonychia lemnae]|uniref:Ankyrin repeat and fyve domain-containing protein 1 n=1 Tax=Stylonychia lemnae TaxID=5949 RepID=A0A077ZZW3_STYLE|nr:ankyrin repeat and fyve domain-containing protein 1 [Stylonychia lemnae]|eukprot:CDW74743.1 ankyrin repeat and fyve domain-containing protein 1 [Stylonychia lemnae]